MRVISLRKANKRRSSIMTTFNPELVDEDNPELTRADFAAMIPAEKFFADRGLPMPRKRGDRGAQKTPTKKPV